MFLRIRTLLSSFLFVFCATVPAHADEIGVFSGVPVIEESGVISLNGQQMEFWGIDTLADDQQCWRDGQAWNCGEQATTALQHYVALQQVTCRVKGADGKRFSAQCSIEKEGKTVDIATYLVSEGWAMNHESESEGRYQEDERFARMERRGIWTSRFQTASDWKEGIQRYVEYNVEPESEIVPAADPSQIIVGPPEFVE